MSVRIRPVTKEDRNWVRDFIREQWGDEIIMESTVFLSSTK